MAFARPLHKSHRRVLVVRSGEVELDNLAFLIDCSRKIDHRTVWRHVPFRMRERHERTWPEHSTDPTARIAHLRKADRSHDVVESREVPQRRAQVR